MSMNPNAPGWDNHDPDESWDEAETQYELSITEPEISGEDTGPGSMTQPQVPPPVDFPREFETPPPSSLSHQSPDRFWGCAVPGFGVGIIVLALVALALFLPPINLLDWADEQLNGTDVPVETGDEAAPVLDFQNMSAQQPRIVVDGLTVSAAPEALSDGYGVSVTAVESTDYLAGQVPAQNWFCGMVLPDGAPQLVSSVYSLMQTGTPPNALDLEVAVSVADPAGTPALYAWNAARKAWEFMPGGTLDGDQALRAQVAFLPRCVAAFQPATAPAALGVALNNGDTFTPAVVEAGAAVYPTGLRPLATGALQGVLAPGFETGRGYAVLPLIANYVNPLVIDSATVNTLLENPALRQEHARQLAAFALRQDAGYDGVVIDYREIAPAQRAAYAAFVQELADLLHSQDRTLLVVVPGVIDSGTGYDWAALGRATDALVIDMPLDPAAYGPDGKAEALLDWAVTQVERTTLRLSLSALNVEDQGGDVFVPVSLPDALRFVTQIVLSPAEVIEPGETITAQLSIPDGGAAQFERDEALGIPTISYMSAEGATLRRMWITDATALSSRLALVNAYGLGGAFLRDLMSPGVIEGITGAVTDFALGQANTQSEVDLVVSWTAFAGDEMIAQAEGAPDQPFVIPMAPDQSEIVIEAQVAGITVGTTAVAVAAAPTPTPEPTMMPTPEVTTEPVAEPASELTPEPTSEPTQETATVGTESPADTSSGTPSDISADTAVDPAAEATSEVMVPVSPEQPEGLSGEDLPLPDVDPAFAAEFGDTFALAAHVKKLNATSILTVGRMKLEWLRLDAIFTVGADAESLRRSIEDAKANGFNVLVTVYGIPAELEITDWGEYVAGYATFTASVASMGVDAIEVWQSPNTAPAWPSGAISPGRYTQLLAYAYEAVKTVNPEVVVISGGLTPVDDASDTGQSDTAWNDDVFAAGLVEAGAAAYADCVGVHYLQGTVMPSAIEGDPRGASAMYYLPTVLDRASNAFGGSLPVCVTALGYLVPEGYAMPDGYEWAAGNTTARQGELLVAARDYLEERQDVPLMVIENVDFTTVSDTNLNGAYALIRPDGNCPACAPLTPQ